MLGLNIRVQVHQISNASDDDVGGAIVTGTVSALNIPARISANRPTQAALEAGLEVNRIFDMIVGTQGVNIRERDEIEVTWPANSPYYGLRFRVIGRQYDSRRPSTGHTEFTLSRIERSRSRQ